jgi:hypothetical protein
MLKPHEIESLRRSQAMAPLSVVDAGTVGVTRPVKSRGAFEVCLSLAGPRGHRVLGSMSLKPLPRGLLRAAP